LVDEERALNDASAQLEAAQARHDLARVALERAQLQLDRATILSPFDGRVLKLLASPGTLVGSADAEGKRNAEVVSLYQPDYLQVRADVRLEDVGSVEVGQPVRIETAASREPLSGKALQVTSSANIQKNTLEVKVSIENPPPALRPEMLATVTFLTAEREATTSPAVVVREHILIPQSLAKRDGEQAFVWLATGDGRATKRRIVVGPTADHEMIQVLEGLTPTDKLIDTPPADLVDGEMIAVSDQ
jgi:RND family efflux transporter MFP subunit